MIKNIGLNLIKNTQVVNNKFIKTVVDMIKIFINDMSRCDLFKHASAMAYVTIFSLVPSLAAIFGVISFFKPVLGQDSFLILKIKDFILSNLAAGSGEVAIKYLDNFISNLDLTKIGITGFAGTIFSLALLLRQIELAFNKIWLVKKERNIFKRFVYFWTFLTLGTFVLGVTVGVVSGFSWKNLIFVNKTASYYSHPLVSFLVSWFGVLVIFVASYKIIPNCFVPLKYALVGALPSSFLFFVAAKFYSFYVKSFTNYQIVYGALWAIPVFLMWIYILWLIALGGALLSWRAQRSFILEKDPLEEDENLSSDKRFLKCKIKNIIPYIVVLAVYQRFLKADGVGLSVKELISSLNLPSVWIFDALDFLESLNLIVPKESYDDDKDYYQKIYFPTISPNQLTVSGLIQKIEGSFSQWFGTWEYQWPLNYEKALKFVLPTLYHNAEFTTLNVLDIINDSQKLV